MTEKAAFRPLEQVHVDEDRAGQRLDNFLFTRLKGIPRTVIYRIMRTGQVRVNKGRVKPHYRVQNGDIIRIPPLREGQDKPAAQVGNDALVAQLRNAVIYEDKQIVVLNKPSGLAVHGGSGLNYGLIEVLKSMAPDYADCELVHRLDRGTSGCLLLAKNHQVLRELHGLLRQHRIEKRYLSLLKGAVVKPLSIDAALSRVKRGGERLVNIEADGKTASTHISPLQHYRNATLCEVQIDTGRTHQIRVHCASLHHAVAGDEKYGDREFNTAMRGKGLKRLFLHASGIRFYLDREYIIEAPLAAELDCVLETLDE